MKYNVLIIGIETCRKDAFQCYNPNRNTPFIQKFAEKSLIFDNYVVTTSNTYQSWGCLFSGKYAHNSGIGIKPRNEINAKLMNEIFFNNGYYVRTEDYGDYKAMGYEAEYPESIGELREPFFMFIAERDLNAHTPYGLSDEVFKMSNRDTLIEAHGKFVERLDSMFQNCIEKYLNSKRRYDSTIVILTADHGDMIEDGYAGHFENINPQTTNIPFIMYHPQIKPRRIDELFSNIDIFPTLLDFCGIKCDENFDGMNLSSNLLDNSPFPDRVIQIGPSIGCKDIRLYGHGHMSLIQNYEYSRKEVLMRYKDYKNREYVNKLFANLENENYFKDEWVERSKTYNNLDSQQNKELIDNIIIMSDVVHGIKIIDAGAGTGIISTAIVEKIDKDKIENVEIYAIDQCYSMLKICPDNKNIKKYVADIEHMMFIPDSSIDRIICRMVLHSEFERIDNIIKEFKRILKDNGNLILSEGIPMNDSLLDFYKSFLFKKEKRDVFTIDYLIKILKDFHDIKTQEIILKNQSIKNWLDNSGTEKKLADEIFRIHLQAPKEIKEKINMIEMNDDIYCDWKFITIKCTK